MRTLFVAVVLPWILVAVSSTPSLAFVGFGARVGFDDTSFDAHRAADFTLGTGTATVVREEIGRPLLLGGTLETGLLPVFDLEIAGEVAFKKYHFDYTTSAGEATSEDVNFGRVSALATLKKNLVSIPPVTPVMRIYAGGGVGLHYVTPLVGRNLVVGKLTDATDTLDTDDVVEYELATGVHGLVGLKLKAPAVPFAITAEARYIVKSEGDYEEPGSHLSVYAGVGLGF